MTVGSFVVRNTFRNKRRLIELFNEQKQAIISRVVTCGLDRSARVIPSGIDWLEPHAVSRLQKSQRRRGRGREAIRKQVQEFDKA